MKHQNTMRTGSQVAPDRARTVHTSIGTDFAPCITDSERPRDTS